MTKKLKIDLPEFLFPYESKYLVRIGDTSDGSYLVDYKSIINSNLLISIGVGWTFDFEKSFLKINPIPLIAFDGSTGVITTLKKIKFIIIKIFKNKNKEYFLKSFFYFTFIFRFYYFFKNFRNFNLNNNYRKFHKKFVGMNESQISINEILQKYDHNKTFNSIFFQIDIEGGEYDILEELMQIDEKISGLIIEFHDAHLHLQIIQNFIEKFKLSLVHTHINNIGGMSDNGFPKVLELTFSNNSLDSKVTKLPSSLDKPNSDKLFEYSCSLA